MASFIRNFYHAFGRPNKIFLLNFVRPKIDFKHFRFMSYNLQKLEFNEFGDPDKVLNLVESTCEEPDKDQVIYLYLVNIEKTD